MATPEISWLPRKVMDATPCNAESAIDAAIPAIRPSQTFPDIAAIAAEGVSVVVISSEMPEIIGVSHRVAVMREGQITGILSGDDINETEIVRYAAGLKREQAHD